MLKDLQSLYEKGTPEEQKAFEKVCRCYDQLMKKVDESSARVSLDQLMLFLETDLLVVNFLQHLK